MGDRGEVGSSGFGSRLRAVREEKGLTQKQLGELTSTHWNTIARLERGEHEPTWLLVLAMAKALGVDCTAFNAEPGAEPEKPAEKKPAAKKGGKKR